MKSPLSLSKLPRTAQHIAAALLLGAAGARAQVPNTLHHTLLSQSTARQVAPSFALTVATNGTVCVVGAPLAETTADNSGQAFVFDAATGALLHTLNNPTPAEGDNYGFGVAVSGNLAVVGTPNDRAPEATFVNPRGSVYVYDLSGLTPTEPVFTIGNPLPSQGAQGYFGRAVAISGTRIVVGAVLTGTTNKGAAYVFDVSSATPTVPVLTLSPEGFLDTYGAAVAIEGTRVVVSAPRNDNGLQDGVPADSGSVYVYELNSATPATPIVTLRNPAPAASDYFGTSVAMSGSKIVAGAPNSDIGAANTGRAYVFDTAGADPAVPVVTLINPFVAADDNFGIGVTISGNTVLVAATFAAVGANPDAGSVYVYNLAGATPAQHVQRLDNPSPAGSTTTSDAYGFSMAISGSRALIGAYMEDTATTGLAGIAYGYELAGATPTVPSVTFNSPVLKAGDLYGSAVAVSGTRAVVGGLHGTGTDTGYVVAYDLSGPSPVATALPNPRTGNAFGAVLAMSGSKVAAGAYYDSFSPNGSGAGIVYIFDLAGATPGTAIRQLNNPSPASLDLFGYAVAISGNRVVVGAHQDDTGGTNSGAAYVYDLSSATPTVPVFTLNNPTPANDDNFGISVAIDGTRVAVGAIGDDTGATDAGSAYVYDLSSATPTVPLTLNNPSPQDGDKFGNAVIVTGTRVVVAASMDDAGVADAGTVYSYDVSVGTSPVATLLNPAPAVNDQFGASLAVSGTTLLVGAPLDDASGTDSGTAWVYDIGGANAHIPLVALTNPTPNNGDKFAAAVGISGTTGLFGAPGDDTPVLDKGVAHVYGLERPEIVISQPAATNIVDGGTKNCGTIRIGEPVTFTFTLRNTGTSDLSGISLTKNGNHAADFIVTNPPALVGPGGSTTFTVQFNPTASGTRTAALHIASNDFDENPFDINLIGLAFSVTEDFDGDGMNDWAEFQLSAQGFDWHLSQPALVNSFYAGANSAGLFTQSQLEAIQTTPLLGKDPATGEFIITLRLEKSTNLTNFSLFPATSPQVTVNGQGELQFRFPAPGNISFFKLLQR